MYFVFKQWGGTLKRSGPNATHVTAQVNLAAHFYAIFTVFALVMIWYVIATIAKSPVFTLAIAAFCVFGYGLIRQQRRDLARLIQSILSPTHW